MYELMRGADADSLIELIDEDGVVFVGTDAEEWWEDDPAALHAAIRDQLEATGGFDIVDEDPTGYSDGDIGWYSDDGSLRLPDGTVVPMRQTGVLRRVGGQWKFVQSHASVPADINQRLFGDA